MLSTTGDVETSDDPSAGLASPSRRDRSPALDAKSLVRELSNYREPSRSRSAFELAITLVPYLALSAAMFALVDAGYWVALLLAIPAGSFLLRLFLIQHDCGHGAFWPSRSANDWTGRILGVLTITPYECWRRSHALHHAGTGNLDARGFGDVDTVTVDEFRSWTKGRQLLYRVYRHPVVLLGFGPIYLFVLRNRLPVGLMTAGSRYWVSAIGTNVTIALVAAAISMAVGIATFLIVQLTVTLIAATVGVWLFYVQHQFEHAHWESGDRWSFHDAALQGSSHLHLPPVLRWFTANIGAHHIHHLVSRVPFYRIPEVLRDHPQLVETNRLTIADTWRTFRLALWDADERRMVSFGHHAERAVEQHPENSIDGLTCFR